MRIFRDGFDSTTRTAELKLDLLTLLFSILFLLLLNLLKIVLWKFASTHWTTYATIFLRPMLCPYLQTLKMEIISTLYFAVTQTHVISHRLLTNRTDRILLQFHSLGKNDYFYLLFLLFSCPYNKFRKKMVTGRIFLYNINLFLCV